jgi:hypothetical protein
MIGLVTADTSLDCLVKMVSAWLLHCKITPFPFIKSRIFGGVCLNLSNILLLHFCPQFWHLLVDVGCNNYM